MRVRVRTRVRIHTRRRHVHRVAELKQMRQDLSQAVDLTAWGGKVLVKDHLKRVAGKGIIPNTYGSCLKEAITRGGAVIEAYREYQKEFEIGKKYRDLYEVPAPAS